MTSTLAVPIDATEEAIDAELLHSIVRGLAGARCLWDGLVSHAGPSREWVKLLAHPRYEAWLIGWPPAHATAAHDHGGSSGVITVVGGVLTERIVGDRTRIRRLAVGDTVAVPANVVHDVSTSSGATATSIHVYSPPLSSMSFYDDEGAPSGVSRIGDDAAVLGVRASARALHPAKARR